MLQTRIRKGKMYRCTVCHAHIDLDLADQGIPVHRCRAVAIQHALNDVIAPAYLPVPVISLHVK